MGSDRSGSSADAQSDDEGPISRDELEARNNKRSLTVINGDVLINDDGDILINDGGDVLINDGAEIEEHQRNDGLSQVLRERTDILNRISTKIIVIAILFLLIVSVWRFGAGIQALIP